ncbi:hypothetical protein KEM48_004306 [Puccinia striiformis f. sp. tritici PST-130]|nr:hypothetical protein KEM48_004306 [Puccinia striiformis f. sp. tritici PST-130]
MSDRLQAATNAIRAVTPTTESNSNGDIPPSTLMNNPVTSLTVRGHWCSPSSQATVVATQTTATQEARAPDAADLPESNGKGTGNRTGNPTGSGRPRKERDRCPGPGQRPYRNDRTAWSRANPATRRSRGPVANQANPVETAKEAETVPEAKEVTLANELQAQKEGDFAKAKMFYGIYASMITTRNMKTLLVTSLLLLDSVTSRLGIDLPSSSHEAIPDLNFPPEDTTIELLGSRVQRKWESDASSPEDFAMADASPSSSKRGQDPDSPTEKRGKIRSVADIMEETSRVVTRSQRKLEPSGKRCFRPHSLKDMSLQQIGGSESKFILKSTFHPGELPSGGLPQFFDIYNWNYVQASSQGKIKGNRNRMAPEDGAQAVSILEEYKRLDFDFGDQFQSLDRSQTLRDIVLKVSDEKLDLGKYPSLLTYTLLWKPVSNHECSPNQTNGHSGGSNQLFRITSNEYLSAELVSSILSFLEKFWMEIDGGKSDILKDHPLLQRNSELLKTSFSLLEGKQMSYANHVDFMNNEYKQLYPMAWNIIAYWVKT